MCKKLCLLLGYCLVVAIIFAPQFLWADQADILYKEGLDLEKGGKRDFAVFRFFTITRNYPNSRWADEALFKIAEFYYENKDYFNARETFEKFIDQYPRSPLAEKAKAYLEEITVVSHKSDIESSIRYVLSNIETFKSEEKWGDMEDECDKLSAFQPLSADYKAKLIEYYKMCGSAYLKEDALGKAKVVYEKLIKIAPDDTEVLNTLYEINRLLKPTP
ncbi:MAG: tetratricopeptide repeat protein [Candidatus Omnitrophica bacterium]|nr:tetratricopeptide repeat protein [Candidatus Omnitrophota bacterium]MBU4488861.1 tetratricopeptide repeat protein [Candidatus Omnitrophota bacterium]MCG2705659.1 tetratricopeptide repeat protein [Candidatus Omnitrophota bacterium]